MGAGGGRLGRRAHAQPAAGRGRLGRLLAHRRLHAQKAVAKAHGLGKNEELLGWLYVGGKPPRARAGPPQGRRRPRARLADAALTKPAGASARGRRRHGTVATTTDAGRPATIASSCSEARARRRRPQRVERDRRAELADDGAEPEQQHAGVLHERRRQEDVDDADRAAEVQPGLGREARGRARRRRRGCRRRSRGRPCRRRSSRGSRSAACRRAAAAARWSPAATRCRRPSGSGSTSIHSGMPLERVADQRDRRPPPAPAPRPRRGRMVTATTPAGP